MLNLIGLALLIVASLLFVWLLSVARNVKSNVLRWTSIGVLGLLLIATSFLSGAIASGLIKQYGRGAHLPVPAVEVDADQVARGKAISDSFCGGCHSKTATLTGGKNFGDEFPMSLGSFVSANLTPAGPLARWTDGEIFRAIRNSVDANGRWLVIMSLTSAGMLSDKDITAVIAYLRSLPPAGVPTPDPPDQINIIGLAMVGSGILPIGNPVSTGVITAPPIGPTPEYGAYLVSYLDCRICHGSGLTGGTPSQMGPLGPDLTIVKDWSRNDFISTMRTGMDPNGHQLTREMPWRSVGRLSDVELTAMYAYVTGVVSAK
jgi:mono/diheme cytochrome c family protein